MVARAGACLPVRVQAGECKVLNQNCLICDGRSSYVWVSSTFLLIWWISIIRLVTIIWWAPIIIKFHHKFGYARTWNDLIASESPDMRAWKFVLHFCCKILNLYHEWKYHFHFYSFSKISLAIQSSDNMVDSVNV